MPRLLATISIIALFLAPIIGVWSRGEAAMQGGEEPAAETRVVDITADLVYPYKIGDTLDVYCLVGDFAAQHNGAIITADSAVRYSDKRIECYGNVVINKNTTYAYADWAIYDGDSNEANLYSQIIKVVDGNTTLYTYDFAFNTQTNIGRYSRGGVTINGENLVESNRGFFDSNSKVLTGVDEVSMRSAEYEMKGDSVIYNTQTEFAQFFEHTNIWNDNGDYLYTDRGEFDKDEDRYTFTRRGYILTEEQEIWSDSLDYFRTAEHVIMRHDIQLDDTTHKSMSFGDYGEYWRNPGDVLMTRNPAVINYDPEQGGDTLFMRADTIFIFTINELEVARLAEKRRADSLSLVRKLFVEDSIARVEARAEAAIRDSLEREAALHAHHDHHDHHDHDHDRDHEAENGGDEGYQSVRSRERVTPHSRGDSVSNILAVEADTLYVAADIVTEALPEEIAQRAKDNELLPLDSTQRRYITMGAVLFATAELDSLVASRGEVDSAYIAQRRVDIPKQDSVNMRRFILEMRSIDSTATLKRRLDTLDVKAQKRVIKSVLDQRKAAEKRAAERVRAAELAIIAEERLAKRIAQLDAQKARAARASERQEGRQGLWKRLFGRKSDVYIVSDSLLVDSLDSLVLDSLVLDSLTLDSMLLDTLSLDSLLVDSLAVDSLYRLVIGVRNSRTYRADFQTVSDSLVTSSADSTIRLYYSPIMWHEQNQIAGEQTDIFTANEQITHINFNGNPIMSSKLFEDDTTHYNQIAGRVITSYFRDQEIYQNDVEGNAQTLYYMQDEQTTDITGLMVVESGSATFYIENQDVDGIAYRTSPVYTVHPVDKIPASQSLRLKGFEWYEELRPERNSVFVRTIRPSQREERRALVLPHFPINEELEQHKRNLIDDGEWRERSELIDAKREAWLNSLGFKSGQPREEGEDPFEL